MQIQWLFNRARSLIGWFVLKDGLAPRRRTLSQTSHQKWLLIPIHFPVGSNQPDQWNLRRARPPDAADLHLSTRSPPTRCLAGRSVGESKFIHCSGVVFGSHQIHAWNSEETGGRERLTVQVAYRADFL